ncbi:MAG: hypothetical protein GX419_00035, partial [Bacteroidales bacterium]|nr:hypothetical protein [Bacteroidales bacterium]
PDFYFNRAVAELNADMVNEACADLKKAAELGDKEAKTYQNEFCKF